MTISDVMAIFSALTLPAVMAIFGALCAMSALKVAHMHWRYHKGTDRLMSEMEPHLVYMRLDAAVIVSSRYKDKGSHLGKACYKLLRQASLGPPYRLQYIYEDEMEELVAVRKRLNSMTIWVLRIAILGGIKAFTFPLAYFGWGNPIVMTCLVIIACCVTTISTLVTWMAYASYQAPGKYKEVVNSLYESAEEEHYMLTEGPTPVSAVERVTANG